MVKTRINLNWKNGPKAFSVIRSVWLHKFVNSLVLGGKKNLVIKQIRTAMGELKKLYGQSPILTIFEALETSRPPVYTFKYKKGAKQEAGLEILSWWRQYMVVMTWIRNSVRLVKAKTSLANRVFMEVAEARSMPHQSKLIRRKAAIQQIIVSKRLKGHFRWR